MIGYMTTKQLQVVTNYVIDLKRGAQVAELGAYLGKATVAMLKANRDIHITAYDWFDWTSRPDLGVTVNTHTGFLEQTRGYEKQIDMIPGDFEETLKSARNEYYDFILWDGAHSTAEKQTTILKIIKDKIAPEAVCLVDDVNLDTKMKAIETCREEFDNMKYYPMPYNLGIFFFK